MKKANIIVIALAALLIASCGNSATEKKKKTFNPKERTSNLSDEGREALIAEKRAQLNGAINLDTLLFSHGVKLSVLPPALEGDINENVATRIATKLLEITTANGIGGLNDSPNFALGARMTQTARSATGTAPQKMIVNYDVTYEVLNAKTGETYATATDKISGVGNSFEEATSNAVQQIKNTPKLQKMLQTGSQRIIKWYNENIQKLKMQVEQAVGKKDYALALALVESVPQQATAAFNYAQELQPKLLADMKHQHAAETLAAMKTAIAQANGEFDPAVAACLQMLPTDSPEYKEAQSAYDAYTKKMEQKRAAIEKKAAEDEAYARKQAEIERQLKHEKELVEIEAEKMKSKYEAQASAVAMEKSMRDNNKGFWGKLGDRIISGIDKMTSDADWD